MQKRPSKSSQRPNIVAPSSPTAISLAMDSFPIVGIGASAGGLEAFDLFLAHVPANSGLAFVLVQHLDPTRQGMMAELLQRSTSMPVAQIEDGMRIQPDHVYVIPPNHDLSIQHGVLHLSDPFAPRGLRLPIDSFFRSLADDQQEKSIGVILSGMGSDGTLGLSAIKEKGGVTFAQSLDSAKFDGMPRSAQDAAVADVMAPAEELPGKIVAYLEHLPNSLPHSQLDSIHLDQNSLQKVILLLRKITGHDFSHYKMNTIYRRLERRMGLHQITRIADYTRFIHENSQEANLLYKELLIGVTNFFRDPPLWERLKNEIIPDLLLKRPAGGTLRIWSAGCSTGEEAYSLAMVFREALDQGLEGNPHSVQIFASDLDRDAVDKARTGIYPANIAADVSEARLRCFFTQTDQGFQVNKEIRQMVIFAYHDLIADPPFTKLDLLSCRNLLIYLDAELQKRLLPLFHYSLKQDGILLLGNSESASQAPELFVSLGGKERCYRQKGIQRIEASEFVMPTEPPSKGGHGLPSSALHPSSETLQHQLDALLLNSYTPAAVLATEQGDIVYISGKTGKYLEPAAGKANLNILAMAREGLNYGLSSVFAQAVRQKTVVVKRNLKVGANGGTQYVNLTIQPLTEPTQLRGMVLVIFTDVAPPPVVPKPRKGVRGDVALQAALEAELQQTQYALQVTREEMQSSQEEVQSANEELQSTNEELQSTNEELTTSKEEMQSMNEELQTVNQELLGKIEGLFRANDDMNNLLNSTDIATLFLDDELKVRRFTSQTAEIVRLIPGDMGRPITDIVNKLNYPELADDAREVLRTLMSRERQVSAMNDRWFRVRIIPYRTQTNHIDGLVVTFTNITELKGLENTLQEALRVLQGRFDIQATELVEAKALEDVMLKTQKVLEGRLAERVAESIHANPHPLVEK